MQELFAPACPLGAFTLPGGTPMLCDMDTTAHTRPIHVARWRNFRQVLADRKLTITTAAQMLQKPQGQVSHFGGKRPTKVIGDQIASEIERVFGLADGALDAETEAFSSGLNPSQTHDVRQSYAARLDVPILAEAVKVVSIDEAINGVYPHFQHAALLLELYDRLASGEDSMELVAKLTHQRSQGEVINESKATGAARGN